MRQTKPVEIIVCGDIENFRHIEGVTLVDRKEEAHSRKVALLRNKAAEVAKYNAIAWCDDDVILDKEWLQKTIEHSSHNGWEILSGKVLLPDGGRYWDRCTLQPHKLVDYDHPSYDKKLYQSSAFFLTRKEVWQKVKWDETKLVYADREGQIPEDIQYSFDLINNGYMLSFNENSLVWHNDDTYIQVNNLCIKKNHAKEMIGFVPFSTESEEFLEAVNGL